LLPIISAKVAQLLAVRPTKQQLGKLRIRTKKGILQAMEKSIDPRLELSLPMLRDLVNKLAVISGHCDLLGDRLRTGSQSAGRVGAIQELAREMAKELNEYQCRLLAGRGVSSVAIPPLARKAG
jgi:hypothetical protein